jgi:hypothetical protein
LAATVLPHHGFDSHIQKGIDVLVVTLVWRAMQKNLLTSVCFLTTPVEPIFVISTMAPLPYGLARCD